MAQAFLVNFPFLFWFNNLNHFRMIFPKTREIEEPCRETVRNDKKSWDSRQNRESWQVCVQHCKFIRCWIEACLYSFSEVMGETKGKKIGTLRCRGLKPPVIRGYAAAFGYWFRTFGHTEQYSEAIITAEDGSQRVIPKGNPMSSPGKL